jgi:nucleotide-binding universal stress UspA family protein
MFRTILVPVDGTDLAERALPYATALARPADGHVILLRAEPLVWQERHSRDGTSAPLVDPSCHAWLSPANPSARMTLEAAAARVQADGVTAEVDFQRYLRGEAPTANVILTAVQERHADLVVVSTHGRSGFARWYYGSVADGIVRGADIPVMLVPATVESQWPENRTPRILVALDGSRLAEEILDPIGRLAAQLGAELLLVRVVDRLPLGTRSKAPHVVQSLLAAELAEARRYLALVLDRVRRVGMSVTARAVTGAPATTIATVAQEEGVDLIAMATHGCGGLRRLAVGSVADSTLQRTTVPLLLVRPFAITQAGATPAAGPTSVSDASVGRQSVVASTAI